MRIRVHKNGPYEVSGTSELLDYESIAYMLTEEPIYLCRCGRSDTKPFCDGSHKKVGFQAVECVRLAGRR